jgi:hypothetical protein
MNLMRDSYRHIHSDHLRFEHYLDELRQHRAWEKVPIDNPYGSEEKMLVAELGRGVDEIQCELDAARQDVTEAKAKAVNTNAPDLLEPHRPKKPDTPKNNIRLNYGTSDSYAHARLRRDRPEIHARVLAGEISANAGMIEAGFRKKPKSRRLSSLDKIHRLLSKCSGQDLRSLLVKIQSILD